MSAPVKALALFFREGPSDKEYRVQIEAEAAGTFAVNAYYGRRGSSLTVAPQGKGFDAAAAEKAFLAAVNKKTAKGYAPAADAPAPIVESVTLKTDTALRPQLLNPIDRDEAQRYLDDDAYGLQLKYDGVRIMVRKRGEKIVAANRKGQATTIPSGVLTALRALPGDYELDGELVSPGHYYVFDALERDGVDLRKRGYQDRYAVLAALVPPHPQLAVAATYLGPAKREAFDHALAANFEGVVFKRLDALHTVGRPNRGGSQLKCKFWDSASCIVTELHDKGSVGVSLYDAAGQLVSIGSVTTFDTYALGDIVEVRYLYVKGEGGRLYQPVMLGKRTDLDASACTMSQLKYTAA